MAVGEEKNSDEEWSSGKTYVVMEGIWAEGWGGLNSAVNVSYSPVSCDSNKLQVRLREQFPPHVWKV